MIKSKKLLCQAAVDSSEVEASSSSLPSSNSGIDNNDTTINSNTIENNKTAMKKKKKLSVRNEIQMRGSNANVYWRCISMEDLRLHPLYIPLPPSNTVNITSVESLSLFRQDSLEWSLLHRGRLTTSKAAACLGLYEPTAAELLNVPRSLTSHHRVLSAFYELQEDPIDLNELKALSLESLRINEQAPRNKSSQRTWRANNNNTNSSFPFSYHPDIRFVKTVRGISSASSARMHWGTAQEATSILAVINYFASTNTSVKIKEVGLLPLEQVSEAAKDDDTFGLGIENSQKIKEWIQEGNLPNLGASPDGIIDFDDGHCEILECKNSSPFIQMNSYKQSSLTINQKSLFKFKGLGSWFIPQLMLEILCAGPTCTGALLIQLSATSGAQIYRVERDNEYITLMLEWLKIFYVTYVTQKKEPKEDFHISNEKYLEFLKATKKISDNCKVVSVIPQDSIQRSSLNTKYFI